MGSKWREMTLGEFVTLQRGHDLPDAQRNPGHVPILGSFGITGWHSEAKTKGPGVTIGRSGGSIGVVSYTPDDYWPLNTALYVKDFHGNDAKFAYYFLKTIDFKSYNSGSAQPSLNRNHIHPLPVKVPSPETQKVIAGILSGLDDKIALNHQTNTTLESMAQALFKSWFVDFDPVIDNALAAGNPIPEPLQARADARAALGDQRKSLPNQIRQQFPDRFVLTEEMGWVPEGWEVAPLSNTAQLKTQSIYPNREPEKVWTHFSIPAFDNGMNPSFDRGETIKSGKYEVPKTAILASKLNPQFPRIWMPDVADESSSVCSTEFMPFVPNDSAERPYVYSLFCSDIMQSEISNRVTGSTGSRQRVKPKEIAELPILTPSQNLRLAFSEIACSFFDKKLVVQCETLALQGLRDTLLPKLLSGELRIPEAERQVAETI